jgi:NAD(P)-dependent dehydrogenase (short-subunit alcohol dehydrogenase family)
MTKNDSMVISKIGLRPEALVNETMIVTGAGGGIGYETTRALLWLGANVVIAEINDRNGEKAASDLSEEFDSNKVMFIHTDVGDEASVQSLCKAAEARFGQVDVVINNATIAVLGAVKDIPIDQWDASYRVNLRGPVLMAKSFLPGMLKRDHGVFVCVSSVGGAFLGGYETFKAAQVYLANTMDAELEGTNVIAYTIGPGLVPTETATNAVAEIAPLMGMSLDEFYKMNKNAMLSIEEAGAGFAASVVFAEKFRGQEISSMQALKAADIQYGGNDSETDPASLAGDKLEQVQKALAVVHTTLKEQSEGWKSRSIFERQWVIRDFKKTAGMPVEEWLSALETLKNDLSASGVIKNAPPFEKLAGYYNHMAELAKGYEKNPAKLEESLKFVYAWKDEVDRLIALLK